MTQISYRQVPYSRRGVEVAVAAARCRPAWRAVQYGAGGRVSVSLWLVIVIYSAQCGISLPFLVFALIKLILWNHASRIHDMFVTEYICIYINSKKVQTNKKNKASTHMVIFIFVKASCQVTYFYAPSTNCPNSSSTLHRVEHIQG